MSKKQKSLLLKAFTKSLQELLPSVDVLYKSLYYMINSPQEKSLRVSCQGYTSPSKKSRPTTSVNIHHTTLQCLAIEIYKKKVELCPSIVKSIFNICT